MQAAYLSSGPGAGLPAARSVARWRSRSSDRRRRVRGFAGAPILTSERIVRRLAERIAQSTLDAGHRLLTIACGMADASAETTVDELVEAADRAMYRQKHLMRKRTPA